MYSNLDQFNNLFCEVPTLFFFRGKSMEEATKDVIDVQIPKIKELNSSTELSVENIDVFCEKGVFDTDATRRILKAGKDAGLAINFHGDELHPMQSGEVCFIMYLCCVPVWYRCSIFSSYSTLHNLHLLLVHSPRLLICHFLGCVALNAIPYCATNDDVKTFHTCRTHQILFLKRKP